MARNWWLKLVRLGSKPPRGERRPRVKQRRALKPWADLLEDRSVPAIVTWTGKGDGVSWGDGGNWDGAGGAAPGPADNAQIASAFAGTTITSSGPVVVNCVVSDANLSISGGSFT